MLMISVIAPTSNYWLWNSGTDNLGVGSVLCKHDR
jgi:hypothetical protein